MICLLPLVIVESSIGERGQLEARFDLNEDEVIEVTPYVLPPIPSKRKQ